MSPNDHPEIADELKAGIHRLAQATALLFVLLIIIAVVGFFKLQSNTNTLQTQNEQTTIALCAIRSNIKARIGSDEGLQLKNDSKSLSALTVINCPSKFDKL